MANNGNFKTMQGIIQDLVDSNGNFRTIPIGQVKARNLSKERIHNLQSIIRLLLSTGFTSYETKYYLTHKGYSASMVYEELRDSGYYNKLNTTDEIAVRNKISFDQRKMNTKIGETAAVDMLSMATKDSIYMEKVNQQFAILGKHKSKDGLIIDFDKNAICTELEDEDFENFITIIEPYFKTSVEKVKSTISPNEVGYFNYLLNCPTEVLNGVDLERKNRINELMGIHEKKSNKIDI